MAVDDSGKRARLLPCLAILRYTVATVVTVLAVVVIVMVIAVGVRPDDVSVSVVQGHVRVVGCIGGALRSPYSESGSCSGFGGRFYNQHLMRTVYTPLKALSFKVFLSVDNPSGRGIIYCSNINISLHAGTAAGMEIGSFKLQSSNFDFLQLKPQTSHKISRIYTIGYANANMLKYIAYNYGWESSFRGAVVVTMNTSSVVLTHHSTSSIVKFVCSPVYFSVGYPTGTAPSVKCAKSN